MNDIIDTLIRLGIRNPKFEESVRSSVTTAWGVDWDDEFIARDIMQNFFDANRRCLSEVSVRTTDNGDIVITAPTAYDLTRLYLLGSEKGSDDVGAYGEGFKAAAVCILRRHRSQIVAASGTQVVLIRVDEQPAGKTNLYPLVYDRYSVSKPIPGNQLFITNPSPALTTALKRGLTHFFYEGNELIGSKLLWNGEDFLVYQSTTPDGHLFYRNLRRGDLPGIPLVLILNKEYKGIEKMVAKDRDRNAFGDQVRGEFYKVWARSFFKYFQAQRILVEAARPLWEAGNGHPLLAQVAASMGLFNCWPAEMANDLFGDRYFASSPKAEALLNLRYIEIESDWHKESRIELPGYFEHFGVSSAARVLKDIAEKAKKEALHAGARPTTRCEQHAIRMLSALVRELAPAIMAAFDGTRTQYTVARTENLLGELKKAREYKAREVFLAEAVFDAELSYALAVFLHEHAHIFGYDGSREFTDALTNLIESLVQMRSLLDAAEEQWNQLRGQICIERKTEFQSQPDVRERLRNMNKADLLTLVERIPESLLKGLIKGPEKLAS